MRRLSLMGMVALLSACGGVMSRLASLLVLFTILLSGCATHPSQVSHQSGVAVDEDRIADDLVRQLSRAWPPAQTRVHLYPSAKDGAATHGRFEDSLRAIGYTVEPAPGKGIVALALLAESRADDALGTWCLTSDHGQLCREYRVQSGAPAGPVSTNLALTGPGVGPPPKAVIASDVVWFAGESGQLGPQGRAKVDALIGEFIGSGAEAVRIVGVSTGRSEIGNAVLAEQRAQTVADAFFDAGVAPGDIQLQTVADTEARETLPSRAAIVSFLTSRRRP